jgi:predicted O-methyltransferase YrrM
MLEAAVKTEAFLCAKMSIPARVLRAEQIARDHKLPSIAVPPPLGSFLNILAGKSSRVLEVGTLGGVSTCWLAGEGRHVTTIEVSEENARVAKLAFAGMDDRIKLLVGDAKAVLVRLPPKSFEFMFIDADKVLSAKWMSRISSFSFFKASNVAYVKEGLRLVENGGLIVVDNVIREGKVVDGDNAACLGTRKMFEFLATAPEVEFCALQTLDSKGYDGVCIVRLKA